MPGAGTDARRFVGEERDSTGLDYFGARYFSMTTGRFTSVDPIVSPVAMVDPQKWNRYAYARNNPLRFVDPTGMDDEESRPPLEMYEGGCSAICQEFDDWAEGLMLKAAELPPANAPLGGAGPMDDVSESLTRDPPTTIAAGGIVKILYEAATRWGPPLSAWLGRYSLTLPALAGRGSSASLATRSTVARNIGEQLAIEIAMLNARKGTILPLTMGDPRWPATEGWVKMDIFVNSQVQAFRIHYVFNPALKLVDDFKIIIPGSR